MATQANTSSTSDTRSRRALIKATQKFLELGVLDFTIADVAKAADTAIQTIYNHFSNREELISAAARSALDEFQIEMIAVTSELEDPLEQLSANMRLYGRLPESHPRIASIVVNTPQFTAAGPRGFTQEAFAHVTSLRDAGLINPMNLELALMTTVAATEKLMILRAYDQTRTVQYVDDLACQNLIIFGVAEEKAKKLVERSLPKFAIRGLELSK